MTALGTNGSTRHWRRLRLLILTRDRWTCHYCGGYANTVDHVVPRVEGGTDHPANLVACCSSCNSVRSLAWVRRHRGITPRGMKGGSSTKNVRGTKNVREAKTWAAFFPWCDSPDT